MDATLSHQGPAEGVPSVAHVLAFLQAGMSIEARNLGLQLLERDGGSADLFLLLGAIHCQLGIWETGLSYVEQCLAIDSRHVQAIVLRARLLHLSGRSVEAVEACDAGLQLFPGNIDLILHKAEAQEQSRQPGAALTTLQPLLWRSVVPAVAAGLAARALHALGRSEEGVNLARRAAEDPHAPAATSRGNWMQAAKICDALGRYDEAMAAAMNAHARAPGAFDVARFMEQVEDQISTFASRHLHKFARGTDRSSVPVFLVGMPRSGTSLVEQIIAAHPQARPGGELPDITIIARSLMAETKSEYRYPDCVDDVTPEIACRLADGYLRRLRKIGGDALRVTNKAVDQYEHVGLIWLLFPGARVIHVLRDPLDTCLSCFTSFLNSKTLPYVTNLEHLALVYQQNQRLMQHWKQTLDIPILTVQYEELVADQERITRQIIDFLGLPWDDRCLRYWESDRTVMTLSYDQVDKPIYDSSIGRWKKYERHLGPLKKVLGMTD